MDIARISTISPSLDVQTDFAGLDDWTAADAAVLTLLYGHGGWPKFDPGAAAYTLPLAAIRARLSLAEDDLADCLPRLARISVRLTSGNRTPTTSLLDFYDLNEREDGETIFTYAIPQPLVPHLAM